LRRIFNGLTPEDARAARALPLREPASFLSIVFEPFARRRRQMNVGCRANGARLCVKFAAHFNHVDLKPGTELFGTYAN
jgi:hypothetical protein